MTEHVPKGKEKTAAEPFSRGNATIVIRLKDVSWDELVSTVSHCQSNPYNFVVEVHVGDEVFDA